MYHYANGYGWKSPGNNRWGDTYTMDRGTYFVNNSGSRIGVQSMTGTGEVGGLANKESFCVVSWISTAPGTNLCGWVEILFTGPDGYTPTWGTITWNQLCDCTMWDQARHAGSYYKTYNRSITFYGVSYPAGSHVYGTARYDTINNFLGGNGTGKTLPLTSVSQANYIDVYSVCYADGSGYRSGSEYAGTQVIYRGVNCDVEGYW